MKIVRSLLIGAVATVFCSAAFADTIDPKVGTKSGGGSTAITITNPNPIVTATAGTTGCTYAGDTCVVDVFQNELGVTLTNLTLLIGPTFVGSSLLTYTCNSAENFIFANCSATTLEDGSTEIFLSGGSVASATQQCVGDNPLETFAFQFVSCKLIDPDAFKFVGGEFAVDIEGTITNGVPDLTPGTSITTQAITPEPGAGLLLLFGMAAFGCLKLVARPS